MLNWIETKRTKHTAGNKQLPDHIELVAQLPYNHTLIIWSHPYSNGEWTAECRDLGFGGKYYWLDTTDMEKAKEVATQEFVKFLSENIAIYSKVYDVTIQ